MFNLNLFINKYVTQRSESMFARDIDDNRTILSEKIKGKTVLVIGGAGSIGSSFIKALLPFKPQTLVVVDINENALAELTRDLRSSYNVFVPEDYVTYPMDYSSAIFERMFRNRGKFDIVANFSAHKHVRSEKDIFSVEALLQNNIINAKKLLDLLIEFPPETFFCVSTDKAANPVNIMGASKRIMEDVIFSYSNYYPVKTARFANVAFSNGSLPAGFLDRMRKLQPLSAPCDVKRYFVSPEESGQICLLACILGDNKDIYFPKLKKEQMMKFDEIAKKLILENGYEVLECQSDEQAILEAENLRNGDNRYPVYFSESDTSGEKAYEEFFTDDERTDMNRHRALGIIIEKETPDIKKIDKMIDTLSLAIGKETATKKEIISIMKEYLPNFAHIETEKSLDCKM